MSLHGIEYNENVIVLTGACIWNSVCKSMTIVDMETKVFYMADVRGWRMRILNLEVALTRIHVILTHVVRANTVFLLGKCAFPFFISHAHSFSVVSSCLLWLVILHYKFLNVLCKVGKWRYFRSWNSLTEGSGSHGYFCLVERQW